MLNRLVACIPRQHRCDLTEELHRAVRVLQPIDVDLRVKPMIRIQYHL